MLLLNTTTISTAISTVIAAAISTITTTPTTPTTTTTATTTTKGLGWSLRRRVGRRTFRHGSLLCCFGAWGSDFFWPSDNFSITVPVEQVPIPATSELFAAYRSHHDGG